MNLSRTLAPGKQSVNMVDWKSSVLFPLIWITGLISRRPSSWNRVQHYGRIERGDGSISFIMHHRKPAAVFPGSQRFSWCSYFYMIIFSKLSWFSYFYMNIFSKFSWFSVLFVCFPYTYFLKVLMVLLFICFPYTYFLKILMVLLFLYDYFLKVLMALLIVSVDSGAWSHACT